MEVRSRFDSFEYKKSKMASSPKAIQSELQNCDINTILQKYNRGIMPRTMQGHYSDVSQIGDYQTSLARVQIAQEAFASLPANLRRELNNDPSNLETWILENRERAIELGMLKKPEEKTVPPVAAPPPEKPPEKAA